MSSRFLSRTCWIKEQGHFWMACQDETSCIVPPRGTVQFPPGLKCYISKRRGLPIRNPTMNLSGTPRLSRQWDPNSCLDTILELTWEGFDKPDRSSHKVPYGGAGVQQPAQSSPAASSPAPSSKSMRPPCKTVGTQTEPEELRATNRAVHRRVAKSLDTPMVRLRKLRAGIRHLSHLLVEALRRHASFQGQSKAPSASGKRR